MLLYWPPMHLSKGIVIAVFVGIYKVEAEKKIVTTTKTS